MPIPFHFDESMHGAVAHGLRRRGVDVTISPDADLLSAPDQEHLAYALSAGRVLVTHDRDFLRLAAQGVEHSGIVYCHIHARSPRAIIHSLLSLWHAVTPEEMRGRIVFL
jgi:predicted nuclease of predicted toxin-antitoxin system